MYMTGEGIQPFRGSIKATWSIPVERLSLVCLEAETWRGCPGYEGHLF